MPFYFVVWTEDLIRHLAENGVTPEEFEQVVCDSGSSLTISRSTGNPLAFGYTRQGRKLACVYKWLDQDTILPITAFEPGEE
jgi:hypothetical protein